MINITLSISLTLLFLLPVFIGLFLFRWKRNDKIIASSVFINIIFSFIVFFLILEFLNPSQEFKKSEFEKILSTHFETKFPTNIKYIATQFKQEKGLLSCSYWIARLGINESLFNDFLEEIKADNWTEKVNIPDKITGQMIRFNYESRYMSGMNYEIDFFDDNQTIRIYIIDCP